MSTYVLTPPQFHAAVEQTPTERSLWLAIADYLAEEGAETAAEALRWAVATGFQLHHYGSDFSGEVRRYYWQASELWRVANSDRGLMAEYDGAVGCRRSGGVHALNRLLVVWQLLSPEERQRLWTADNTTTV